MFPYPFQASNLRLSYEKCLWSTWKEFDKRISVGVFHVCIYLKKKRKKKKKRRKIVYEENKIKSLKFQFEGVMGGVRRIAGKFEFL